jgi:regulator of RNase E activity RraA
MITYKDRVKAYDANKLTERPSKEIIELFEKTPTAFISDAMKRAGLTGVTITDLFPINQDWFREYRKNYAGPAITMRFVPNTKAYEYTESPYMHTEIVEQMQPGDVLVIDGLNGPHAFWGENAHRTAIRMGAKMIVDYGYTRDCTPIRKMNLPVYATGITMNSYVLHFDVAGYNVPVNCGGAQIRAGDIVVGDADGVLVVPKERVDEIAEAALDITDLEQKMNEWVDAGESWGEKIYPEVHARKYLKKK